MTYATPEFLRADQVAPAYGSLLLLHHILVYHILSKLFPVPRYMAKEENCICTFKLKKKIKKVGHFIHSMEWNIRDYFIQTGS